MTRVRLIGVAAAIVLGLLWLVFWNPKARIPTPDTTLPHAVETKTEPIPTAKPDVHLLPSSPDVPEVADDGLPSPTPLRKGTTLRGFVFDESSGDAIPDASVTLRYPPASSAHSGCLTDASGAFSLRYLPYGEALVRSEKGQRRSHRSPEDGERILLSSETEESTVTLYLTYWGEGTVTGTVYDPDRIPVSKASVDIKPATEETSAYRTQSGEDGVYRACDIPTGEYRVAAQVEGYVSADRKLVLVEGETREGFDLIVRPAFSISGRVTSRETGKGVPGARVVDFLGKAPQAMSLLDGTYEMFPAAQGRHFLEVYGPFGTVPVVPAREVVIIDWDAANVDFVLTAAGSVSGIVRSATGPVEGARVTLATCNDTPVSIPTYRGEAITSATGYCRLGNVSRALVYSVFVRTPGYASHLSEPQVMEPLAHVEHPPITLNHGGNLLGRVLTQGNAELHNVLVDAEHLGWGELYRKRSDKMAEHWRRHGRADSAGRFRFQSLQPGKWEVSIPGNIHRPSESKLVEVPPAGDAYVEFELWKIFGPHSVTGWVLLHDGAPAVGYRVVARGDWFQGAQMVVTDGSGAFIVPNLPGRSLRLIALMPDDDLWGVPSGPEVRVIPPREGVTLIIQARGTLTGRVVDGGGRPLRHYDVQFYIRDPQTGGIGQVYNMEGYAWTHLERLPGRFVARNLLPGVYRAEGWAPDRSPTLSDWVEVAPGRARDGADLVFRSNITARGRVLEEESEKPIPGVHVSGMIWAEAGVVPNGYLAQREAYTDANGRFTLEGLYPGEHGYNFLFEHPLYARVEFPIMFRGQEAPAEVTVHLSPKGCIIQGVVTDAEGNPLPHQIITIYRSIYPPGADFFNAITDSRGHYETTGLPPGQYMIRWEELFRTINVGSTKEQTVTVDLQVGNPQHYWPPQQ